ncbi:Cathepsin L [Spironucleus salmonicida]|uniref:Cathepsin L n=1 Tax=Spironucleus salmonicida TaxID=348837 RepID=V6LRM8_9EUKA|nr:Cathepsin L [Spironucleus salmonicida]|eukprot:EST43439.1 Papain family cysteine protease [Spironucleus salmonicida]
MLLILCQCDYRFAVFENENNLFYPTVTARNEAKLFFCQKYSQAPFNIQTNCLTPDSPFYASFSSIYDPLFAPFIVKNVRNSLMLFEHSLVHNSINQGLCGSCYAIPAKFILEAILYQNSSFNKSRQISVQQLISGSTSGVNRYCYGGHFQFIIQDLIQQKFNLSFDNPYIAMFSKFTARPQPAKLSNFPSKIFQIFEVKDCQKAVFSIQNETQWNDFQIQLIKNVLNRGLPLSGQMNTGSGKSSSKLNSYKDGILNGRCSGQFSNHQILLVGYGKYKGEDIWVFQNSWGTKWGVNGLFFVKIGSNAYCTEREVMGVFAQLYNFSISQTDLETEWASVKRGQNGVDREDGSYEKQGMVFCLTVVYWLLCFSCVGSLIFVVNWAFNPEYPDNQWILVSYDEKYE